MSHASLRPLRGRLARLIAGTAACAVAGATLALTSAGSADAAGPNSPVKIFTEENQPSGDITNAINPGWWGHEGASKNESTAFSMEFDPANVDAALAAIGPDARVDNLGVAFVLTSSDGSAENPTVTPGQTAGQAFQWFTATTFASSWSGTNLKGDYVGILSTKAQYDAWYAAGQLPYGYDIDLVSHNTTLAGSPISTAPVGTSVLNTWPANTNVSMVYFAYTGFNSHNEPILAVGSDGTAETAWVKLKTLALPSDGSRDTATGMTPAQATAYRAARTSAGYQLVVDKTTTTTTALTVNPATSSNEGTAQTLTATVSPAPTAGGTVTFKDGSTTVGTGTTNASGVATLTTTLPVGSHSLTAVYAGDSAFEASTSSAVSYTVNGVSQPTTVALAVNAGTATAYQAVEVQATVGAPADGIHPASIPAGTVHFHEGSLDLGTVAVNTTTGVATLTTSALGQGAHTVTADFVPTNTAKYGNSTATTTSFSLAAALADPDVQAIQANIPAGAITISTPYTSGHPLVVNLALDPTASYFTGSSPFGSASDGWITVTDGRAGNQPWTVKAQSSNLTSGSNVINSQNVGLTGLGTALMPTNGNSVPTYTDNPAANPPVGASATGSVGLGGIQHPVASVNHGLGTWKFGGWLTVTSPTSNPAGTYNGTVTFTVS